MFRELVQDKDSLLDVVLHTHEVRNIGTFHMRTSTNDLIVVTKKPCILTITYKIGDRKNVLTLGAEIIDSKMQVYIYFSIMATALFQSQTVLVGFDYDPNRFQYISQAVRMKHTDASVDEFIFEYYLNNSKNAEPDVLRELYLDYKYFYNIMMNII